MGMLVTWQTISFHLLQRHETDEDDEDVQQSFINLNMQVKESVKVSAIGIE